MAVPITASDMRRVVPGHQMEIGGVPFEGLVVMTKGMEMVIVRDNMLWATPTTFQEATASIGGYVNQFAAEVRHILSVQRRYCTMRSTPSLSWRGSRATVIAAAGGAPTCTATST